MDQQAVKDFLEAAIPIVTEFGLSVIGALAILIAGKFAASICAGLVKKAMTRAKLDVSLIGFTGHLVRYTVLAFAIIAALEKFGVQTTSFIAVLGAAGLAVGLALQGSLSNFAAGVLILIFKPFRVDDLIEAGGHLGAVKEIGIFTTTMASLDNRKIIVPNAAMTEGSIVNLTGNDTRRVDMSAGISYTDDIIKARDILMNICTSHPLVLSEPQVQIEMSELGDSSVNFVVRPWSKTEDYWSVYFDVMRSIKQEFDANGISIPFPQRDVHLYQQISEK